MKAQASLSALTLREEVLPERIPTAGLIILRNGQLGEPEVTLSPLRHPCQHPAELEGEVEAATGRANAFDALITAIGAALDADRTFGGMCDWIEPEAPASVDLPIEGAAAFKAAVMTVTLHKETGLHRNTIYSLLEAARVVPFSTDGQDFGSIFLRAEVARVPQLVPLAQGAGSNEPKNGLFRV